MTVYERDEAGGGLIRFGVPDFKIEKWVIERRLEQLAAEGVEFRYGVDVGRRRRPAQLRADHDAVVIATGSRVPRNLPVPGRELDGVHFAMDYLYDRARVLAGGAAPTGRITAAGKHVLVVGGGDTGADCVGHSHREGAASVTQIELLGEPPDVAPGRPHAVAALAREAAHLLRAQGGRRARLRDLHHQADRQRPRARRSTGSRTRASRRSTPSRAPRSRTRSTSSCWRWASCTPSSRCSRRSASTPTRAATPRPAPTRRAPTASSPRATPAAASR